MARITCTRVELISVTVHVFYYHVTKEYILFGKNNCCFCDHSIKNLSSDDQRNV